ncbi:phosphopantetheine-binding protein [Streptomyces sp. NRRL S-1022]|uniref:phosphopantetheine-binding protein n=1 Tax=Streptomyces sp. NRRL S-1022 TaxID=1463880 RepID=UPI0004C1CDFC|nr:acyl carrier protein [Streptomyces sp. NRRL S-1022]
MAEQLDYHRPTVPVVSNLTGRIAVETDLMNPAYWVRHAQEPVRFADGVRELAGGVRGFLELGPDAVLSSIVPECPAGHDAARAVPVARGDRPEPVSFLSALGDLHAQGRTLDWSPLYDERRPRFLTTLPTYAFQRRRHWLETDQPAARTGVTAAAAAVTVVEAEEHAPQEAPGQEVAALSGSELLAALVRIVAETAANVLGHEGPEPLDRDAEPLDLGITSLMAVELRTRLAETLALDLPPTLAYDHLRIEDTARFLDEELNR